MSNPFPNVGGFANGICGQDLPFVTPGAKARHPNRDCLLYLIGRFIASYRAANGDGWVGWGV